MRPKVTAAMCGLSVVVVAMALKASEVHTTRAVAGVAQAGVVMTSPSNRPATTPRSKARAKAKPKVRATHAVAPATTHTVTGATTRRSSPTRRPSPSPKPATSATVTGQAMDTQYGPVQVQIVVRARKIIQANAIEYPQGSARDQEINSYAIPQLDQETLQAQSAQIDTVSGATYTSEGYIGSLQSAIDQAHQAGLM